MRNTYQKRLEELHTELIRMGAICEEAIASAIKGLLDEDPDTRKKAIALEKEIDMKEHEIETLCVRLLLREQPVAGDLRQITVAQRIIADMERIGDQAQDIAELSAFLVGKKVKSESHIAEMAAAAARMLTESVDSFVESDLTKAHDVIRYDDIVDGFFIKIKDELIELIAGDRINGEECLDLMIIAKYLERIGDHATNIAEWVVYSITGERGTLD
ncbi:MAG: phosphate signaling complex protein PhoU [Clostridiales bacterium]|jgi:phosphate transport system protein|nr:phosphate signaling complex protein PhoU [Clostridiales bacterium]